HNWFSPALNKSLHEIRERLRRARANRIPALPYVGRDYRYISGIGCRDQSRIVESCVLSCDEFGAQFWQTRAQLRVEGIPGRKIRPARNGDREDSRVAVYRQRN